MSLPTHWRELDRLILVAGHAVYVADDFTAPEDDRSWFLQSFQRGEPPFYIEHACCGVELAASERRSLLMFSGGQTRREAGPRSEGQSYWLIAKHFNWWHHPSVALRSTTEEFARDSFENVLFGIARFHECTGRYPRAVDVVSWAFKAERFELHRKAIGYPKARFSFVGVNNPVDLDGARAGEKRALEDFASDPYGTRDKLAGKRRDRDPFSRVPRNLPPYQTSCPEILPLLQQTTDKGHLDFDWERTLKE